MKSYNHLYEKFISEDNIRLAIKNASKGKLKRKYVKAIHDNPDKFIPYFKHYAENFKNKPHKPITIYDGIRRKQREIIVPTFDEQIIHHMIVNVMKPIFEKSMYYHSYGSLPGKGGHRGMKTIKKWIEHGGRNIKYCLKMDIKKYFDSVPTEIVIERLRLIIHDERFMRVLEEVVNVRDKGLPLGFYTSQWLANWYLTELDHKIKQEWGAVYYIRYMDDMVIFGSNKRRLHRIRQNIDDYLHTIGLELKENWQIFRFGKRQLDFMGFRFFRDRITLRKSIYMKAMRKARRIAKNGVTVFTARQMLSYSGWLKCTDTYNAYLENIKPFVNIQYLKRRISYHDRMEARARQLQAA